MDSWVCQTSTATPAEPGGLLESLVPIDAHDILQVTRAVSRLIVKWRNCSATQRTFYLAIPVRKAHPELGRNVVSWLIVAPRLVVLLVCGAVPEGLAPRSSVPLPLPPRLGSVAGSSLRIGLQGQFRWIVSRF
jgi:hypothetical protein